MKKQELRLGNIIMDISGEKISEGEILDLWFGKSGGSVSLPHREHIRFEVCEGIPLTEEWLLKLGFIENGAGMFDCLDVRILHYRRGNEFILCGYHMHKSKKSVHIKHVHQLQNLFFALTEQELNLEKQPVPFSNVHDTYEEMVDEETNRIMENPNA